MCLAELGMKKFFNLCAWPNIRPSSLERVNTDNSRNIGGGDSETVQSN